MNLNAENVSGLYKATWDPDRVWAHWINKLFIHLGETDENRQRDMRQAVRCGHEGGDGGKWGKK